jgi:hypothetical protein
MFRRTTVHRQAELMCPLLKITCCYTAVNYSYYGSCVMQYTQYNFAVLNLIVTYLLTAIGLTPGGSSAVQYSTVHIYTQTIHRTT